MLCYLAEGARAGVAVLAYTDAAKGTMAFEGGGGQFVAVELHPRVVVAARDRPRARSRLHRKAHANCFIARSVNFPVTHEPVVDPSGSR